MKNLKVKVDELIFELSYGPNEDKLPKVEIENKTSMFFVTLDVAKAKEIKNLLNRYIQEMEDRSSAE
jgi:hypothetical protein